MEEDLKVLQDQIKEELCDFHLQRRKRLRTKLLLADPSLKKFWRFLKGQMKSAGKISALYGKEKKMVFEQEEIEEAVLDHFRDIFQGQRHPVYIDEALPTNQAELALHELDQLLNQQTPSFNSS